MASQAKSKLKVRLKLTKDFAVNNESECIYESMDKISKLFGI